jgi:hypothetical protein
VFLALVVHPHARAQDARIGVRGLFHPREQTMQASRQEALIIKAAGQGLVLGPGSSSTALFTFPMTRWYSTSGALSFGQRKSMQRPATEARFPFILEFPERSFVVIAAR